MIETLMNLDGSTLVWIQENMRNAFCTPIFTIITTLGDAGIIWLMTSVILLIPKKTRKVGIMCLVAFVLSFLINNLILKNIVARARPFDALSNIVPLISKPTDFSFPSGHTASSFACAWVMFLKLPKKYGIPAVVLAALIGFSRLYLGVHYPSDVLLGMISGIIISYLAVFLTDAVINNKSRFLKHNN